MKKEQECPDCGREMFHELVCGLWCWYCDDCEIHYADRWKNEAEGRPKDGESVH